MYPKTSIPEESRPEGGLIQSSSLLPLDYGRSLDESVAARDPFYAVSELFTFCAFSESQFLNMIQSKLDSSVNEEENWKRPLDLSDLLYMQRTVKRHMERLRDSIDAIEAHGNTSWPRSDEQKHLDKAEAVVGTLTTQYNKLLRRAESLSMQLEDQTRFLTNQAMIDEATRARNQATEVTKLTRLAFFYIPISFVASFFGMNLDPLTDAPNSLFWFFVISVPVLSLSMAFMQWDISDMLHKAGRALKAWRRELR
ncbi:Mg2+ transporter protein CorA-like/Zinc transport protein ZntB [Macrophomina phaseolina MS6]|uniref:Mg2+ transporter protein CorA-like/Zinc transport protein ZntB n=2 Tax=Macrophomina phaseolina TaxID=35725 RepID=K2RXC2_MACPH|nr:Mg2+ transporter protein CorA-like/Zinc transport protein ZntB [Macrophomina phaseolina MS6]